MPHQRAAPVLLVNEYAEQVWLPSSQQGPAISGQGRLGSFTCTATNPPPVFCQNDAMRRLPASS